MNEEQKFWNFIESECLIEKQENNKPYRITIKERAEEVKKYENWYAFKKDGKNALMFFAEYNPLLLQALHKNPKSKKIWEELSVDGRSILDFFLLSTKRKNCYSLSYNNYEIYNFIDKLNNLPFKAGPAYFNISEMLGDLTFTEKMLAGSTEISKSYVKLFTNLNSKTENHFLFGTKAYEEDVIKELKKNITILNGSISNPAYSASRNVSISMYNMLKQASDNNIKNISDNIVGLIIELLEIIPGRRNTVERIKSIKIGQEKDRLSDLIPLKSTLIIKNRL